MIVQSHELPSPLLDAHFVEEKIGDGEMGPSDFRTFMMLEVSPDTISAWQEILTPLAQRPQYSSPGESKGWWVLEDDFDALRFYEPDPLTGRTNGWVGFDPVQGRIFIFSSTT